MDIVTGLGFAFRFHNPTAVIAGRCFCCFLPPSQNSLWPSKGPNYGCLKAIDCGSTEQFNCGSLDPLKAPWSVHGAHLEGKKEVVTVIGKEAGSRQLWVHRSLAIAAV